MNNGAAVYSASVSVVPYVGSLIGSQNHTSFPVCPMSAAAGMIAVVILVVPSVIHSVNMF